MAQNVSPRKIKVSKIALVMFLTVLIWVYADLALDETHAVPSVPVTIAGSTDSELWATFRNEDGPPLSSINIGPIVLKGPASRIAEVKRNLDNGALRLSFSLNPETQNMTTAGSHSLDLLDFVRNHEQIRGLDGLTVESCEPNTITVDIVKLVKRELDIQAVDENDKILGLESISQSKVSMFVPEGWGQDRKAQVKLTPSEIVKARVSTISKRPYVVLSDNQERRSEETLVEVKLRPEEEQLETYTIARVTVGFCFSENTQGKFKVELGEVDPEIVIQATPAAKQAYELKKFKLILEIYDDDSPGTEIPREYKYNFPEEYVRNGEIKVDPAHRAETKFRLIPRLASEGP